MGDRVLKHLPSTRQTRRSCNSSSPATSRAAWSASTRGLTPADLAMQVVLPELDGRLLTTAISFKTGVGGRTVHAPEPDGIASPRIGPPDGHGWPPPRPPGGG